MNKLEEVSKLVELARIAPPYCFFFTTQQLLNSYKMPCIIFIIKLFLPHDIRRVSNGYLLGITRKFIFKK
jgi:hypothetical protein